VDLVYQLALTRAEAGQYDRALALFVNRFFPSEEEGSLRDRCSSRSNCFRLKPGPGKWCAQAEICFKHADGSRALTARRC